MASWGRRSEFQLTGTASIPSASGTVTGVGTLFTTQLEIGDVVTLGAQSFKVLSIASNTSMTVAPVAGAAVTGANVLQSQAPKYLSVLDATTRAVLVTTAEAVAGAGREDGIRSAGWVKYEELPNGRKKAETLVAMKTVV